MCIYIYIYICKFFQNLCGAFQLITFAPFLIPLLEIPKIFKLSKTHVTCSCYVSCDALHAPNIKKQFFFCIVSYFLFNENILCKLSFNEINIRRILHTILKFLLCRMSLSKK